MKRIVLPLSSGFIVLAAFGFFASAAPQFKTARGTERVDVSSYPADLQRGYKIFANKCSECHGLSSSLKQSRSSAGWTEEVHRMQAMASSHISDSEATVILAFLNYDEAHRKSMAKLTASAAPSGSVEAGRKFYYAQSCDACHTISGQGGEGGPPLDDVGRRRSRDQLTQRMQERRAGAVMPPLPSGTTDRQINDLVDFLLTLKGN